MVSRCLNKLGLSVPCAIQSLKSAYEIDFANKHLQSVIVSYLVS